jgi:hypothetical protein
MKQHTLLFSFILLVYLTTACNKAKQIHILSGQTWVVTEVSDRLPFAEVGDELTFHDNRLFFKSSNGFKTDGRWHFGERDAIRSPNVEMLTLTSDLGDYDFDIVSWTEEELELNEPYVNNYRDLTLRLKPKE